MCWFKTSKKGEGVVFQNRLYQLEHSGSIKTSKPKKAIQKD